MPRLDLNGDVLPWSVGRSALLMRLRLEIHRGIGVIEAELWVRLESSAALPLSFWQYRFSRVSWGGRFRGFAAVGSGL